MKDTTYDTGKPSAISSMTPLTDPDKIREKAREKARSIHLPDPGSMTKEEIQQLFYEMQVKQIEGELQVEQLRSQLEESDDKAALFRIVTENMLDMVALTDMDGNFTFAGKLHELGGYKPAFLIGKNVMDFVHPEDLPRVLEKFNESVASGYPGRVEYRYRCKDGSYIWFETIGNFIKDESGIPEKILFSSRDITDRRQAEDSLKKLEWMLSEKTFPMDAGQIGDYDQGYGDLTELNRDGKVLRSIGRQRLEGFAGDYLELLGTSSAIYEADGDYALGIFSSGWCRMMNRASRRLCNTSDNVEALNSSRWLCHESCWTDCSRKVIAECRPVDIECNGGIRLYGEPITASGNVVGVINFGYGDPPKSPEKLRKLADVYHVQYDDLVREAYSYHSRPPFIIELAKKRLHGAARFIGSMIETRQAEEALRESEQKHRSLFETMTQGVIYQDADGGIISANPAAEKILGISFEQIQGKTSMDPHWRMIKEDGTEVPGTEHPAMTALRTGQTVGPVIRGVFHTGKNSYAWLAITAVPLFQPGETNPFQAYSTFEDITKRKLAEKNLMESEFRFRILHNASFGGIAIHDKGFILECNQGLTEITGFGYEELIGMNGLLLIAERSRQAVMNNIRSGYEKPYEAFGVRKNGEEYPLRLEARNIPYRDKMVRVVEFRDVTEQKQSEQEREKLQELLTQAQKMESVGRLAGGVAHDFNNKLAIINGYAEMAIEMINPSDPLRETIEEIHAAGKQSADIVRQLLAFARKQTIRPVMLDLNDTVSGMLKILQRLIGENIDLQWHPGKDLWPVKMDSSQVDQIMANLAVNAKDAISDVGKLIIETKNKIVDEGYSKSNPEAFPGRYVMLAVSDDGCGMDQEIQEHLFDPYFTTKEIGKGTGLGLPMVYGIVKQNNGFIDVYSEPGEGTTFKLYFPFHEEDRPCLQPVTESTRQMPGGSETVLVVEDEKNILQMSRQMLEKLGYTVKTAGTPSEALKISYEYDGIIHLLITDVVMPEMNGRDLSARLLKNRPGLKTLYMSGYTANVIAHHGVLDKNLQFIQKPFSMQYLAVKIREALEQG